MEHQHQLQHRITLDQLHLQLMVVTPLDKIHVVEEYVSVIHYVENKNKLNSEVVDMSIMEYKNQRSSKK